MTRAKREGTQPELSPARQFRSIMVYNLGEVDTPRALEAQLGMAVVDEERLAQLGISQASQVLHNAVNTQPSIATPAIEDQVAVQPTPEVQSFDPLPGFGSDEPMPVVGDERYDLAA